jgi:hypothetical protein
MHSIWDTSPKEKTVPDDSAYAATGYSSRPSQQTPWRIKERRRGRSVSPSIPSKPGYPQANRVTLTKFCRCNNSFGDDFEHQFRLAGVVKVLAGSLESFTHRRNHLSLNSLSFVNKRNMAR